jgi:hypothetical protein
MSWWRRPKARSAVPAGFVPRPSHWEAQEQQWLDGIAQHGWLVMDVAGLQDHPGFQYTLGLTEKALPELIVYSLHFEVGTRALNDVAQRLLDGVHYADGEIVPDVLDGDYRTQLWDVTWLQDPLGAAFRLYGTDAVRVRQLVVPDLDDRLPWEVDYAFTELQPVLCEPPNGRGPRRAGSEELPDGGHEFLEEWDLPQDPHLGVVVSGPVSSHELPVLLVVHEHGGDWQVLDGVRDVEVEGGRVMCLHHLVEQDRTLRDVLRTLPAGYEAYRTQVGGDWQYEASVEQ